MSSLRSLLNNVTKAVSPSSDRGSSMWREIFGTPKERATPYGKQPVPGGSWGRSVASGDASFKRLLQAMRSMAPGGWSDDRWEQTRRFVTITYLALHRSGEILSESEFQVFQKDDNNAEGKVPVKKGSDGWKLIQLLEKPNDDDSFGDLLYSWNLQEGLTGMALTWMVPNEMGRPFELYPIPTAIAIPQPAINPDYPDGYWRIQPIYPYGPFSSYPTPTSAVGAAIPAQWMMRFRKIHPLLRYDGYSPLTALNQPLDTIQAMDKSRWYAMKRTFRPDVVLNMSEMEGAQPLLSEEIERIRVEIENTFQSPENVGKLFVATPGASIEEFGTRPADMDYQSGWDQLTSFALAAFGITKPAAGMIDEASYASLYATMKQLYWQTLNPLVSKFARKLTRHLAPFFGDDLIVEIRCKRIDDHDVKFQKCEKLMAAKAITKGEFRKEMDFPLFGDERDDEIAGEGGEEEQMQQQQMMQQQQGVPPDDERDEPLAIQQSQPKPGKLSVGSLGPRLKYLNGHNGRG